MKRQMNMGKDKMLHSDVLKLFFRYFKEYFSVKMVNRKSLVQILNFVG